MKERYFLRSRTAMRLLAMVLVGVFLTGQAAWGVVVVPPLGLDPLNQTPVPEPPQLPQFVKNKAAAVRLGKAFFWDMQVGSDGVTACATCHHSAGVDKRLKNTLNPGTKAGDTTFGNNHLGVVDFPQFGPNYTLDPANDFPLHERGCTPPAVCAPPDFQSSPILRDTNDVVGSQGVRLSDFTGVVSGNAVDSAASATVDPIFNDVGTNVRRVTGRNTPTMINAAFNFTNFWDGRANFIFNGENPFGPAAQDGQNPTTAAGVWFNEAGTLVKRPVTIQFASLASQATGPPLDTTEMSGQGRTFPQLGRKMLGLTPLGKQIVHPGDSVLGTLSRAVKNPDGTVTGANGLNTTYRQMIQDAFQNNLWNHTGTTPAGFTQMEANFSLFWGLAIQLYEATLVSDQTPFDRFLAGDAPALTDQQKLGFLVFNGIGNCTACHAGIEFTTSSAANIAFVNNFANGTIELMFVADGTQAIYDEGFNNTAVTPTTDDLGRGGTAPFPNPLSAPPNQEFPLAFTSLALLQAQGLLPFETPVMDLFIPTDIPDNKNGLFKVPGLRNVELTAPYFHNGSVMTLEEVIDVYVRGGNFPQENLTDLDPIIGAGLALLQGREDLHAALVAFMKSLTDPRVAAQSAPFDHPELFIPEGDPEVLTRLPAMDANGVAAASTNLTLNAVTTPTNVATQTISGAVAASMTTPQVSVNGGLPISAAVTGTSWSAAIGGLAEGPNTITVSSSEVAPPNTQTIITATIAVDTVPPAVTLNPVATPTNVSTQAISGAVEAGATVRVSVNGGAAALATVAGAAWSHTVSLASGQNAIAVTAADAAGNSSAPLTATITLNANVGPLAVNDAASTTADVVRVINVIANDTGVSSAINPTTIVVSTPTNAGGAGVANPDGTVTYTPPAGFTGTDFFAYTVKDLLGAVSNLATVTVSVAPSATAPPPPTAETVSVLRAQFRFATPTSGEWTVEGTTSNLAATEIIMYVGNSIDPTKVIGTTVPAGGTWKFRQAGSTVLPAATSTISVMSAPSGASRLAFPVAVR